LKQLQTGIAPVADQSEVRLACISQLDAFSGLSSAFDFSSPNAVAC
jgi:hypothetical protein